MTESQNDGRTRQIQYGLHFFKEGYNEYILNAINPVSYEQFCIIKISHISTQQKILWKSINDVLPKVL